MTLTIHDSDSGTAPPLGVASLPASRIGPNLYMVAVTAMTTPLTLWSGLLLRSGVHYINGVEEPRWATGAADISGFAYTPYRRSSFVLPPNDLEQVRFALGSCPKMHTVGPDALALVDDAIGSSASVPANRPQLLVLGGDQIAADQVCDTLLMMLTDAGDTLLGPEPLPLPSNPATTPAMLLPTTHTKTIKDGY